MKWQLWYEDHFDRETPRQVETEGRDLVRGLVELWSRHLFGAVQRDGYLGFNRFNLWWNKRSIEVADNPEGAAHLRAWIWRQQAPNRQTADHDLLERIAKAHAKLIRAKRDSTAILALAASTEDPYEFAIHLAAEI
jgi:hypothetical protein